MDGMVVGHEVGGWGEVLLEDLLPIQAYPKRLSRAGGKGIIRRMTHAQPLPMHRVTVDEAATYARVAEATFVDTYGASSDASELATHCRLHFGPEIQRVELAAADAAVFAVTAADGEWLGFVAVAPDPAPPCVTTARPLHLRRLYVVRAAQGGGVGRQLVDAAVTHARAVGADALWLKVWEGNHDAHRFYGRTGWEHIGTATFRFGTQDEDDRVMLKRV